MLTPPLRDRGPQPALVGDRAGAAILARIGVGAAFGRSQSQGSGTISQHCWGRDLPALRRIGFQANRRLLDVQRISQDCHLGEDAFRRINEPVEFDGQHASGLRFADVAVQALLSALLVFRLLPRGFSSRDLRDHWAPLLGQAPSDMTMGQMGYHLRRLRLHGLIERIAGTHRYRVTRQGGRAALFCTRIYNRLLRPGLALISPEQALDDSDLRRGFDQLDQAIDHWFWEQKVPVGNP